MFVFTLSVALSTNVNIRDARDTRGNNTPKSLIKEIRKFVEKKNQQGIIENGAISQDANDNFYAVHEM